MNPTTDSSSRLSAELAALLERVGGIHSRCARIERRQYLLLFILGINALLMVATLRLIFRFDPLSPIVGTGIPVALFLLVGFGFVRGIAAWHTGVDELKRSKRMLGEVSRIFREIEPVIAAEEGWSVVKKAEFRLRLAECGVEWDAASQR